MHAPRISCCTQCDTTSTHCWQYGKLLSKLVQRYPIATSPMAGNNWTETCPLCKDGEETTSYFLLHCQALLEARQPTAGNNRTETCPLCKDGEETTSYFLLHCQALLEARQPYLPEILNTCRNNSISIDSDTLRKKIFDSTYLPSRDDNYEKTCRNMIYRLHNARSLLLTRWWCELRYKHIHRWSILFYFFQNLQNFCLDGKCFQDTSEQKFIGLGLLKHHLRCPTVPRSLNQQNNFVRSLWILWEAYKFCEKLVNFVRSLWNLSSLWAVKRKGYKRLAWNLTVIIIPGLLLLTDKDSWKKVHC